MHYLHKKAHAPNPWVTPGQATALTAHGLYRWHYYEEHAALFETAAVDRELNSNVGGRGDRAAMHVGWVSGALCANSLLHHGREVGQDNYVEAAIAVLDKITGTLTPGGTFWGMWTRERGWRAGWNRNPQWIHSRTIAEAILFIIRALREENARGIPHPVWEAAVHSFKPASHPPQSASGWQSGELPA